jgi:transcriptional regulator with XRE-family HTH domain
MSVWVRSATAVYSRPVKLAECVNAWFESTGRKQNAVAEKAGMLPSKISEIVNGKNDDPQFSTIEKLAKGFGVTVSRFLEGPPGSESEAGHEQVSRGGAGLADSLGRALREYEQTGQVPKDWRGDVLVAIFALTRALQRPSATEDAGGQTQEARR